MKKFVAQLLLITFLLPVLCFAANPPTITPLNKGQVSPYAGVLFSPEASAYIITELESFPERIKIEVDAATATAESNKNFKINEITIQCKTDKELLQASLDAQKKNILLYEADIKKLEENTVNKPLIFGVGFLGGFLFTLGTVFVLSYLTK